MVGYAERNGRRFPHRVHQHGNPRLPSVIALKVRPSDITSGLNQDGSDPNLPISSSRQLRPSISDHARRYGD